MTIYYVTLANGRVVGCRRKDKMEAMHPEYPLDECDISEFKGHLYSNEWH